MSKENGDSKWAIGKMSPDIRLNYSQGLILQTVLCQKCHNLVTFPDVILCTNITELLQRAETEHRKAYDKTKVLCVSPLLLVTYQTAQISNELFKALKQ